MTQTAWCICEFAHIANQNRTNTSVKKKPNTNTAHVVSLPLVGWLVSHLVT